MRRRKYQITDRLEKKLWEVEQKGALLITRLQARRNTPMREGTRDLETEERAKKEFDRLCAERDSQGWNLLESFDDSKGNRKNDAEGARLLKAIVEAPDVVDSYAVYGDWLTERDNPLGEMIATGLLLEKDSKNKKLKSHQKEILDTNARTFLGNLAEAEGCETTWRRGFLDAVEFGVDTPCALNPEEALTTLFGLRVACILRGLSLGDFGREGDFEAESSADYEDHLRLVAELLPKTLRRFEVASHLVRLNDTDIGDVSIVTKATPNLRELTLRGVSIELGKMNLPELRTLQVKTRSPSTAFIESMIHAKWPKLETLNVDFGKRVGTSITSRVGSLVAALPPKVSTIGLRGLTNTDEALKAILAAKSLKQLRTIDLSRGDLSDEGAGTLVKGMSKLDHIEKIDISKQELLRDVVEELRAAFGERIVVDEGVNQRRRGPPISDPTERDDEEEEYDAIQE